MSIGPGVENQAASRQTGFLNPVNKYPFVVALSEVNRQAQTHSANFGLRLDIRQCRIPIDLGLSRAQKIEIRTIQDEYGFGHCFRVLRWC